MAPVHTLLRSHLAQVKQDIWRTSGGDGDSEALVREQVEAVDTVLGKVEVLVSALAASSPDVPAEGAGAAQLAQLLTTESLNVMIAPQVAAPCPPTLSPSPASGAAAARSRRPADPEPHPSQLPLLMMRGYPEAARSALGKVCALPEPLPSP